MEGFPILKSRLIALDIDGTILDKPSGLDVPVEVRDAVKEARESGVRVCISSSRPCFFVQDALDGLGEVDALIGCSGASIAITNGSSVDEAGSIKYQFNDNLSMEIIQTCIEVSKEWNTHASFGGREKILARKIGDVEPKFSLDPLFSFMNDDELLSALSGEPVSCAYFFTKEGLPDEALEKVRGITDATVHSSGNGSFTITNKGTDKGSGLLYLAKHWGIPIEATLAVGNDENDIPMITAAGVGVAVGNASPETLAAADWIAPDVWEAGAAVAIRRFAL